MFPSTNPMIVHICPSSIPDWSGVRLKRRKVDRLERRKVDRLEHRKET